MKPHTYDPDAHGRCIVCGRRSFEVSRDCEGRLTLWEGTARKAMSTLAIDMLGQIEADLKRKTARTDTEGWTEFDRALAKEAKIRLE